MADDEYSGHLYLVHFSWWNQVRETLFSDINGLCFTETGGKVGLGGVLTLDFQTVEKRDDDVDHVKEIDDLDWQYAIIDDWMFLSAIKWHNDIRNTGSSLAREHSRADLFPLQIGLSYFSRKKKLVAEITRKENDSETFRNAMEIFFGKRKTDDSILRLQIWDFSGQTAQLLTNDRKLKNRSKQPNEIHLKLQVYGLFSYVSYVKKMLEREGEMRAGQSMVEDFHNSDLRKTCQLGLRGLHNLGNTCFMNSAIQCLVHTPKFNDYFLGNFRKDLCFGNSLGMKRNLALAFGDLLRELWAPEATPVNPRIFKSVLSDFAPQYCDYKQHDSQEFLAFLLDGLHENLKRICEPHLEKKDGGDYPDKELSIIVDMFQGQYQSTLSCPLCKKVSIKFDPFMHMSLPLPSTTTEQTMTLPVFSTAGTTLPILVDVTVPKDGSIKDLIQAASISCSLGEDETLLVAEIYNNRIHRILFESDSYADVDSDRDSNSDSHSDADSAELIKKEDIRLVAYRILKASNKLPLVVFMHQHEECFLKEQSTQMFGIPLATRMPQISPGSEIRKKFLELLNPFLIPHENSMDISRDTDNNSLLEIDFEFYLEGEDKSKMPNNKPILKPWPYVKFLVVSWPNKMFLQYDTSRLQPEMCGDINFRTRALQPLSLYQCLEALLKEEPLGPDNMWYCPVCKKLQEATKKLDLSRLPEILVIHLKRFLQNQFLKDKLDTFVDFPVDDLDLSSYTVQEGAQVSCHYKLYAVSNHLGVMDSGHYTAFVQHGGDRWFKFDDHQIDPILVDKIKTSDAYMLFYRRISNA